jgi:hypothetical protein
MTQAFRTKGLRVVGIDADGWLVSEYRGARVLSCGAQHKLNLPGHPSDGMALGDARAWIRVIDSWMDESAMRRSVERPIPALQYS